MHSKPLVLGIDLGTSGIRIAVLNTNEELIYQASDNYIYNFESGKCWLKSCTKLIREIPENIKKNILACSIDGTSGTLIACAKNGNSIGNAIPYYKLDPNAKELLIKQFPEEEEAINLNSSLIRAQQLRTLYGKKILIRHQADWVSGWLLNCWEFGEEGNNLRLGWDLVNKKWDTLIYKMSLEEFLPKIVPSGSNYGCISKPLAHQLGLPKNLQIIAGTTDSNAAVIAVNPKEDEGITVLGSTIVVKGFAKNPIKSPGISNHLVGGKWIVGGASNAGGAVLKKFFSEEILKELSRQINPETTSGLYFIPLPFKGERFPVNDPNLKPILGPRPTSDSLYLHGLFEGLARVEAQGWAKLTSLGINRPKKIITIGGGARNPQWRRIREKLIGVPITSSTKQPAEGVARIAIQAIEK